LLLLVFPKVTLDVKLVLRKWIGVPWFSNKSLYLRVRKLLMLISG